MNGYHTIPIIIGSRADLIDERDRTMPEISHSWKCYVIVDPKAVKEVHFKLHESFPNNLVVLTAPPYEINERGWGEFNMQIKIVLFNDDKVQASHYLVLHSDKYPVINETRDTIVYKGKKMQIDPKYSFALENESDEYERINSAISSVLSLCEKEKD